MITVMLNSIREFCKTPDTFDFHTNCLSLFNLLEIEEGQIYKHLTGESVFSYSSKAPTINVSEMQDMYDIILKLDSQFTLVAKKDKPFTNEEIKSISLLCKLIAIKDATKDNFFIQVLQKQEFLSKIEKNIALNANAFSIIIVDIDHQSRINNTYGRQIGRQVLRTVYEVLVKKADILLSPYLVGSFGGDEFILYLEEDNYKNTCHFAENLRETLSMKNIHIEKNTLNFTVSIGLAYCNNINNTCLDDIIKNAEEMMFFSKKTRNTTSGMQIL